MEREIKGYDQWVQGLQGIMRSRNISLDEAERVAREDAVRVKADEHLPYIEAAYQHLKSLEKK